MGTYVESGLYLKCTGTRGGGAGGAGGGHDGGGYRTM